MAVVTDTIADMLTRIRNANQMRYEEVKVPASNIKKEIAKILKEEGFIKDYKIDSDDAQGTIVLTLKYTDKKERVITGLKRISKPGLRVYAKNDDIARLIGRKGSMAAALRQVMSVASHTDNKKVSIKFEQI